MIPRLNTSGTITKLDFYDGATLLGTINIGVADASATFNLPGVVAFIRSGPR